MTILFEARGGGAGGPTISNQFSDKSCFFPTYELCLVSHTNSRLDASQRGSVFIKIFLNSIIL